MARRQGGAFFRARTAVGVWGTSGARAAVLHLPLAAFPAQLVRECHARLRIVAAAENDLGLGPLALDADLLHLQNHSTRINPGAACQVSLNRALDRGIGIPVPLARTASEQASQDEHPNSLTHSAHAIPQTNSQKPIAVGRT